MDGLGFSLLSGAFTVSFGECKWWSDHPPFINNEKAIWKGNHNPTLGDENDHQGYSPLTSNGMILQVGSMGLIYLPTTWMVDFVLNGIHVGFRKSIHCYYGLWVTNRMFFSYRFCYDVWEWVFHYPPGHGPWCEKTGGYEPDATIHLAMLTWTTDSRWSFLRISIGFFWANFIGVQFTVLARLNYPLHSMVVSGSHKRW